MQRAVILISLLLMISCAHKRHDRRQDVAVQARLITEGYFLPTANRVPDRELCAIGCFPKASYFDTVTCVCRD